MPSPMYPTTLPAFFSARMMRSFWLGSISAKTSTPTTWLSSAPSLKLVEIRPGKDFRARRAHLLADAGRDQAVVSGDDLQRNAEAFQAGDGLDDIGLRRIEQDEESQKRHAGFVGFARHVCGPHVLARDAERAQALLAELLEVLLDLVPHCGDIDDCSRRRFPPLEQTSSTFRSAPLVTSRWVSPCATRMLNRLRRKS